MTYEFKGQQSTIEMVQILVFSCDGHLRGWDLSFLRFVYFLVCYVFLLTSDLRTDGLVMFSSGTDCYI